MQISTSMKKIRILLLILCSGTLTSQTTITSNTVSGIWNLAGSPYIVMNDIAIPTGTALTIDPGVVIKFKEFTGIDVLGQLIAKGTSSNPIIFQAKDTLNWSDTNSVYGGSWRGFRFYPYSTSLHNNSVFDFCNIKDGTTKLSYFIYSEQNLKILNTNFTHFRTHYAIGGSFQNSNDGSIMSFITNDTQDTIQIQNCNISNYKSSANAGISVNNNKGVVQVQNCIFNNNTIYGDLIACVSIINGEFTIYNNTITNNVGKANGSRIIIAFCDTSSKQLIITKNKISKNVFGDPIFILTARKTEVDNNLICNNYLPATSCSHLGGVLTIRGPNDRNYFHVRNNIIANNYNRYLAGAGISTEYTYGEISNNHFINNSSLLAPTNANVVIVRFAGNILIKNNLFYSKAAAGNVDSTNYIFALSEVIYSPPPTVKIENNFFPNNFSLNVGSQIDQWSLPPNFTGNLSTNKYGLNPGMLLPTANNNYTVDATVANFQLAPSSMCIDQGNTVSCLPLAIDYAGNARVTGSNIDIGAFEYKPADVTGINKSNLDLNILLYPNPTKDVLNIRLNDGANTEITIYSTLGNSVFKSTYFGSQIKLDLKDLPKGVYFINVLQNDKSYIQKVMLTN